MFDGRVDGAEPLVVVLDLLGSSLTMGEMRAGRVHTLGEAEPWLRRRLQQQEEDGLTMWAVESLAEGDVVGACGVEVSPGQAGVPFRIGEHHVGFDTYDMATQQGTSHHSWRREDGTATYGASRFPYAWPAECDLMAQITGLELETRTADWQGNPFTGDSESHDPSGESPGSGSAASWSSRRVHCAGGSEPECRFGTAGAARSAA